MVRLLLLVVGNVQRVKKGKAGKFIHNLLHNLYLFPIHSYTQCLIYFRGITVTIFENPKLRLLSSQLLSAHPSNNTLMGLLAQFFDS